jgi:hypothetical protein
LSTNDELNVSGDGVLPVLAPHTVASYVVAEMLAWATPSELIDAQKFG